MKQFTFIRLIQESFLFAYQAIIVNKLRTFLSLLGITIGIFAIISVFTMIDWMERAVRESISSLGDNAVYVGKWPWDFSGEVEWWNILKWPVPTIEEYEEIKQKAETVESLAFRIRTRVTVEYRNNSAEDIVLNSATHDFDIARNFNIEKGRYFSMLESNNGKNSAIIGAVLAEKLFGNINPVGKEITIRGRKLIVVGVFKKEGAGGITDESIDRGVLVPINFIRNIVNIRSDYLNPEIIVKAKPNISLPQLKDDLRMILRASRKIRPQDEDNFSLNQASLLQQGFQPIFAGMNIGGWIIGGFSILVGGFGIANIMFVSVKERTNMIGIQKSLGAKNNFILQEFLYESILLSIAGGILGLFLVFCGTLIVNWRLDVVITLTAGNIMTGIVISSVIGIISGWAPAYSASRLDPVEAIGTTF
ncbi:Macrolide export ATP-binding/permease protein MacB [subsurface metagenome]